MALLAIVGVQWRHHQAVQKDEVRMTARAVAASLLDQIEVQLRTDFDHTYALSTSPVDPDLDTNGRFRFQVLEGYEDPERNLKKITVEVYWETKQGLRKETLWCVFLRGE